MVTTTAVTINVPTCSDCGRNLLTEHAWLEGPTGYVCFSCEASASRRAAIEKLTAHKSAAEHIEELRAKARRKVERELGRNLPAHARRDVRRRQLEELGQ
jgi:alpha-ketoglutarate-dependent taurine dioxygenase